MTTSHGSDPSLSGQVIRDRLLSVEEIAKELDLEHKTIADWIRNGSLPALKIGRSRKVLQSTFDKFLAEKAALAEAESAKKSHERNRREELKRFQGLDPDQKWAERLCIGCFAPVNTTRHQRLDGGALCEHCRSRVRESGYSKEMWDRRIRLEVEERNQISEERLWLSREQDKAMGHRLQPVREWVTYRCGHCDKPQCIRLSAVLDLSYEPTCSHEPPFGVSTTSPPMEWGDYSKSSVRHSMLSALAELEAIERTRVEYDIDPTDPPWWVDHCALCDRQLAVVNQDILFTGQALCRCCHGQEINDKERLVAIGRALQVRRPSVVAQPLTCQCQPEGQACRAGIQLRIRWAPAKLELWLSYCEVEGAEAVENKQEQIRQYGEFIGLSKKAISTLQDDVVRDDIPF